MENTGAVIVLEANDPPKVATFDRSVASLTGTDQQVTQCWSV